MLHDDLMDLVMDHYENPRNYGKPDDYDIAYKGGNEGCGDTITVYIKFDEDGDVIKDISFEGEGCIISQASASVMTEHIRGSEISSLADLDLEKLKEFLGKDIVIRRPRCAGLVIDTVKNAVKQHDYNRRSDDLGRKVV